MEKCVKCGDLTESGHGVDVSITNETLKSFEYLAIPTHGIELKEPISEKCWIPVCERCKGMIPEPVLQTSAIIAVLGKYKNK